MSGRVREASNCRAAVAPVVKANALLYVHFERPDLNRARDYLVDFGLLVVSQGEDELFLRGTGSTPYIYRVSRGPARPVHRLRTVGSLRRRP